MHLERGPHMKLRILRDAYISTCILNEDCIPTRMLNEAFPSCAVFGPIKRRFEFSSKVCEVLRIKQYASLHEASASYTIAQSGVGCSEALICGVARELQLPMLQ